MKHYFGSRRGAEGARNDLTSDRSQSHQPCYGVFASFNEAEFMQYRKPVGGGPSSKTWPRWASQRAHSTSTRFMKRLVSVSGGRSPWRRAPKNSANRCQNRICCET